ncbi:MAG: histidine kinase [Rhodospirillaceae bacterium]|nr:histidine kinase [Rhodospirillaceae bacterium]
MTGEFRHAHAGGGDWAAIARDCARQLEPIPDGANLGFLYVTDALAEDMASILTFLRQTSGVEEWVGTVGMGICGGAQEYHDEPAAAVLIGAFPENAFRVFPVVRGDLGDLPAAVRGWADETDAPFAVVHGDPYNHRLPEILDEMAGGLSSFLVGGLTAAQGSAGAQVAGTVMKGGVSGVLFGPEVQVATGLSQGCTPVAEPRQITEAEDNIIMSIDGERALDVMKNDIGELLARNLERVAGYIHAAFPVPGSDTRDYLVRSLVGIDVERGWVAVGGAVEAGDRVMFVRRDPISAEQDLADMVNGLKARLPSEPKGGLYFSCVARGPHMFGAPGKEMALIMERLGDIPLVGFYGNGEISNARLYGYTGVLALFL